VNGGSDANDIETQIVQQWAEIYNAVYDNEPHGPDPDFAGWRSRITGENYTTEETAEWLEGTLSEVRRLEPGTILEVGAGSGLLVKDLVPRVRRYVGTDISTVAVDRMTRANRANSGAQFMVRAADQVDDLGIFDVVVLNSVTHHFPSADYLRRALLQAVRAAGAGGVVFVGDVHSMPLREALYLSVLANRVSAADLTSGAVRDWLAEERARERELVVHPTFFAAFAAEHGIAADIRLKPGRYGTEMNLFRYDVLLRPRAEALISPAIATRVPWGGRNSVQVVNEVTSMGLSMVAVTGVAHPGLTPLVGALATVHGFDAAEPIDLTALKSDVHPSDDGIAPAQICGMAAVDGLACYCTPSMTDLGRYDAVFALSVEGGNPYTGLSIDPVKADSGLTNSPRLQQSGPITLQRKKD
jgi:SAM-dependent methyltransferase